MKKKIALTIMTMLLCVGLLTLLGCSNGDDDIADVVEDATTTEEVAPVANDDGGTTDDTDFNFESTGNIWADEQIANFIVLAQEEGLSISNCEWSPPFFSGVRFAPKSDDVAWDAAGIHNISLRHYLQDELDNESNDFDIWISNKELNDRHPEKEDNGFAYQAWYVYPGGVKDIVIRFGPYFFSMMGEAAYVNAVVDALGYLEMTETPASALADFRDTIKSLSALSDVNLRDIRSEVSLNFEPLNLSSSDQFIFVTFTVYDSEQATIAGYESARAHVKGEDLWGEAADEYGYDTKENFSYVWSVREQRGYAITIFERELAMRVGGSISNQSTIIELITKFGFTTGL